MYKESLHFKVGLSSSIGKYPEFTISVNDKQFVDTKLAGKTNETEYFEFTAELNEGDSFLKVEFKNKTIYDTVLDANGNIVDDLLLNIDSIEIDGIDLGSLLWTASNYKPNYPETYKRKMASLEQELPDLVKNCVNLGWNGSWELPFTSPFYSWMLDNI